MKNSELYSAYRLSILQTFPEGILFLVLPSSNATKIISRYVTVYYEIVVANTHLILIKKE